MSDNYKPWAIDYRDFHALTDAEARLRFLINFAVLAPSSHNSQPWRFSVSGNSIKLFEESARALPESDKNGRQLFLSLGAALENLVRAADFYGYATEVRYFPSDTDGAVAEAVLTEAGEPSSDEAMIKAIITRHSNRNAYSLRSLPEEFLLKIKSLAPEGFRIYVIEDKKLKDKIAAVVSDAIIEAMDDRGFRRELSLYVKNNITKSKVGMPMFGFGMPTPPSLLAPQLLKRFNLNRLTRSQDEILLKEHTPYFIIIASERDGKEDWLKAGQVFESIALLAEKPGIRTAPQAAAIQIGDHFKRLQKTLGTGLRPQLFFRMGHGDQIPLHSPRLAADEVIKD